MAVTNYDTVGGRIIGESTNGVMRNYIPDALGSVVGTALDGVAENTYKFTPYGGILDKTGTAADPSFLWNGGSGYRATKLPNADYYVRRRVVSSASGQWTTTDPLWPNQPAYVYVNATPALYSDFTGQMAHLAPSYIHQDKQCACSKPPQTPYYENSWILSQLPANQKNGFILQYVVATSATFSCRSNGTQHTYSWIEGWQVLNGVVYQGLASQNIKPGVDCGTAGPATANECTKLFLKGKLQAAYFLEAQGRGWDNYFIRTCPDAKVKGALLGFALGSGVVPPPSWWLTTAVSNFVTRTVTFALACCSGCPGTNSCSVTYS